ncbi:MAG: NAD(P)H-dependent flavin oxidoreductase [Desulfobacterales bacterium]
MAKNRICDLLDIRYPIIQAPMNWVSGAELVAAVSGAGGLGTLGPNSGASEVTYDVDLTAERMREQIRKVRSMTDAPFGVNVVIGVGESVKYSEKIVEVIIEEQVPVVIASVGRPDIYTDRLKQAGIKVLHAISTGRHAQKAEAAGVDAVICEGYEAGGHKGFTELTTFALTPMVADAVSIPVVTGGGIGDARGVLAALALGADGIYMGTRFMATQESESHHRVKEAIVNCRDACTVTISKDFMVARDLRNQFTEQYTEMHKSGASPEELAAYLNAHSQYHAQNLGNADEAEICCGQFAGMINEVKSAAAVIEEIVEAVGPKFEALKEKAGDF